MDESTPDNDENHQSGTVHEKSTNGKTRSLRSVGAAVLAMRRTPARHHSTSVKEVDSRSPAIVHTDSNRLLSNYPNDHIVTFLPVPMSRPEVVYESRPRQCSSSQESLAPSASHSSCTDPCNPVPGAGVTASPGPSKADKRDLRDIRADVKALDEGMVQEKQALKLLKLSQEIREVYDDDWERSTLEEAIDLVRRSLEILPSDHEQRPQGLRQLASYLYQYHDDDLDDDGKSIQEAVQILRQLYDSKSDDTDNRAHSESEYEDILVGYSNSLNYLYLFSSDLSVFDEALSIASARLVAHEEKSGFSESLAAMSDLWADRFEHLGERFAIDKALQYTRRRLQLHPIGHSMRGVTLYSLASLLITHAMEFWSEDTIEEALQHFQEALPLFPAEHEECNDVRSEYAEALCYYYEITGNASGLQNAVAILNDLLSTAELEPDDRGDVLEHYARTMQNIHTSTKDLAYLVKAIALYKEAIEIHSGDESEIYMLIMQKALAHWDHYDATSNLSELDEGIRLLRKSLALSPPTNQALILSNLAGALLTKHEELHDEESVDEARKTYEAAIQKFHPDHPIVMDCYARLSECVSSAQYSQRDLQKAAELILHASKMPISAPTYRLEYCWDALKVLQVAIGFEDGINGSHVTIISQIYHHLIDLLPRVAHFGRDLNGRLRSLDEADDIGMCASFYALQVAHSDIGQALELLEGARCIFWTQALRLRHTQMDELPPDLAEELKQLLQDLEDGSYAPGADASQNTFDDKLIANATSKRRKAERVEEIMEDIRRIPRLERFMLSLDSTSLVSAATDGFVVILIPGNTTGSRALILQPGGLKAAHSILLDVKQSELETWGAVLQQSHLGRQRSSREARLTLLKSTHRSGDRDSSFRQLLSELWNKIVSPILIALRIQPAIARGRPRLHWCPTGLFAFLPFHAAGNYVGPIYDKSKCNVFDYVVSSYTPTITALLAAQKGFMNLVLSDSYALLIAESAAPGLVALPNVEEERDVVRATLLGAGAQTQTVSGGPMTKAEVTHCLSKASVVHFACHGIQDPVNPLESGFCLRDGLLTVADLMRLNLPNASFAFLSACETAQGDRGQPNQAIHLCAALLFCGFKSVIGTMWAMSDEDGPVVAAVVYRELCAKRTITADDIAYALDTAVGELRAQNAGPDRWAPFVHIGA